MIKKGFLIFNISYLFLIKLKLRLIFYKFLNCYIPSNDTNKLFLFACGPFGNMLAHQLWESNKKNTYLDIGSTLNLWLHSEGFIRDYYKDGSHYQNKVCVWS